MADVMRRPDGTYMPGSGGFTGQSKRYTTEVRKALEARLPPDEVVRMWDEAWTVASTGRSAKTMVALLELAMAYTMGKPKQTLSVESADNTQLLAALLADRTPLLPPREGIIDGHELPQLDDDDIAVDTEIE